MNGAPLAVMLLAVAAPAAAQTRDLRAERQAMLSDLLSVASARTIAQDRAGCLTGEKSKGIARARAMGSPSLPDPADYCVTVLIRSARDGARTSLRDARSSQPTSASAFDGGFMAAFAKGGALPPSLPTMAALKPAAERCLVLQEPDTSLCASVGYAYGARAFHGETVIVR